MSADSISLTLRVGRPAAREALPCPSPAPAALIGDELANSLTHGVGLALSIAGCWALLGLVAEHGLTARTLGCSIYGLALVALFAASTTYHAVPPSRLKDVLRRLDHACIFLLIAGSYSPLALGPLNGAIGWGLMVVVWCTAAVGAWGKLTAPAETLAGSYWTCIALGWVGVLVAGPLARSTAGPLVILWLLAGGLVYTAGVYFYVRDDRPLYHAVWHLFVLGGTACHFCAIWLHVVPLAD